MVTVQVSFVREKALSVRMVYGSYSSSSCEDLTGKGKVMCVPRLQQNYFFLQGRELSWLANKDFESCKSSVKLPRDSVFE